MLDFTQARHRMLTENIANVDTPHYQAKHLDVDGFQASLCKALDRRRQTRSPELVLAPTDQVRQAASGELVVKPQVEPAENILFHDRTNMSIERQMAALAENAMMHQTVTELLNGRFQRLLSAIRGRMA
jgi:flagellar basal-body rod protein FlgB